jgi:Skp family chaperone for outer membrane proteins
VLAVLAVGLASAPALAALYKWTDANGRVTYSDQPPAGNVKVETLNTPPPPANPNAVKDLAAKDAELKKTKQARTEEETKANKARVEANQLRENCERARGQMIALGNSDQVVLYSTNAQGERVVMTDEIRVRERLRLDAWIRDNCKN